MADALITRGVEIKEQMFGPCGIPAAVDGFRNAAEVLDELGVE